MFSFKSFEIILIVSILMIVTEINAAATKKQDPKCLLPKDAGPCRMSLNRFYYNAQTDSCEEFVFGGCKGNDNKFGFKETCEQACKLTPTTTTTAAPKAVAPTIVAPATTNEPTENIALQLKASTLKSLTYASNVTLKMDDTIYMKITEKPIQVTTPIKH